MWEVYLINNIDFIVDMVHHNIRGDAGRQSERQIRKPVPGSKTSGLQQTFVLKKNPFISCRNSENMLTRGVQDFLCHIPIRWCVLLPALLAVKRLHAEEF